MNRAHYHLVRLSAGVTWWGCNGGQSGWDPFPAWAPRYLSLHIHFQDPWDKGKSSLKEKEGGRNNLIKLLKSGGEESSQRTLLTKVAQTLNYAGSGNRFGEHTHVFASPASGYSYLELVEA